MIFKEMGSSVRGKEDDTVGQYVAVSTNGNQNSTIVVESIGREIDQNHTVIWPICVIPTSAVDDAVSCKALSDVVSSTLEAEQKKQHNIVLNQDNTTPNSVASSGPKWHKTSRKQILILVHLVRALKLIMDWTQAQAQEGADQAS